jgi:hypothetical protein
VNCAPEICNGVDDDCDVPPQIDEGTLPGVGDPCGVETGECNPGALVCHGVQGLLCDGAVGPIPELCDNLDNDCDGNIDGMVSICYPPATAGCVPAEPPATGYVCQGVCAPGLTTCTAGVPSACTAVTPTTELCNGLDDDCNGVIDDGFNSGQECFSSGMGACRTSGVLVCAGDGLSTFCTAPVVTGSPEICDGIDNDCNGEVDDGDLGSPIGEACGGQVRVAPASSSATSRAPSSAPAAAPARPRSATVRTTTATASSTSRRCRPGRRLPAARAGAAAAGRQQLHGGHAAVRADQRRRRDHGVRRVHRAAARGLRRHRQRPATARPTTWPSARARRTPASRGSA